tara:strand:- start:134 stop:277 length:144 start_codon:yes stop_codon:yes gene_type:complete
MRIESKESVIDAGIKEKEIKKTIERKGKKNGKKYINVYIYIYTIGGV